MSDLRPLQKRILERLFGMESGYVCDFSNRTFEEFFLDTVDIDICGSKYESGGTSKANRLRTFWSTETNQLASKLLDELLTYEATVPFERREPEESLPSLREQASKIIETLSANSWGDAEAFNQHVPDGNLDVLGRQIKESLSSGRPEEALDRLHTYVTRYTRKLCAGHSIEFSQTTPLHALFGSYVRFLREEDLVESEATLKILSSSIKVLEKLNGVRNDKSLAHDNELLNRHEASLIFSHVSSSIKFLSELEKRIKEDSTTKHSFLSDPEFTDEEIEAAGDQWIQEHIDRTRGK